MSRKVSRTDLENKLREMQSELDDTVTTVKPVGLSAAAALVVGAVGIAYVVGQRKARKRTTVVEIRRV